MPLREDQHASRQKGLGSSDAAAAIGLHPYTSAVELWMEKRGELPYGETFSKGTRDPARWGQLLEPAIRQEYAEQTARVVRLPPDTLHHPVHKFMRAHPDGITDDGRLYEGKTAGFPIGWGESGTDEIPEQYLIQVQHLLIVTALPVADVAVLIGGQDFRLYEIPADKGLQDTIIEAEYEFWTHVENGTRPEIDYKSPGALNVLRKLYPGTNGQTKQAALECEVWREKLDDAKARGKIAEAEEKEAKAALLDFMGDASLLRFHDGKYLRRKKVDRSGYVVEPTSYIDARFVTKA